MSETLKKQLTPIEADDERWGNLMVGAQAGNEDDFRDLFNEISPIILAFCKKRAGYLGIPEEALQESLLAIHRNRHVYIPGRSFRAWMFAIVRTKLIDQLRKQTVLNKKEEIQRKNVTDPTFASYSTLSGRSTVSAKPKDGLDPAGENPEILTLRVALSQLPDKYRSVIEIVKLEGFSVKEASRKLEISESATKVRLHRGFKMLEKKMRKLRE
jgi:RNA polymerase sigma-70 factor (ECF subfamily)